jgi:ribosomal protein L40E
MNPLGRLNDRQWQAMPHELTSAERCIMGDRLDPEQYRELRALLRAVGPAIAGLGILLTIVGLVSFFKSFGGLEPPRYFWCAFVGLPLAAVGIGISQFAYVGTITRYMAGEVAPVGKDVTNYMVAGTKDSVRELAAAVGEGLASASGGAALRIRCHKCNAENDLTANFCEHCGTSLAKSKPCPECGEINDPDARFCDHCGNTMT